MKPKTWEAYSVELAKNKINFYDPFQRLVLRRIVQEVLANSNALRLDLFAIYDAVAKRGYFFVQLRGFAQVEELNRWMEVEFSLPYYKYNFRQIYIDHILKREGDIRKNLKNYGRQYKRQDESFVELHYCLTSSAGGYYHFQDDENSFCKQNFPHVDIYINIKTLCLNKCKINRILYEYADKYLITRKWLIMKGYSKPYSDEELDQIQIMKIYNNNASVALVGLNISNLILAFKLHELKFNVVFYTNLEKNYEIRDLQRALAVQEGIFYLDDGIGGPFLYTQIFQKYQIQLAQVSNYVGFIDQNGKSINQFRVRESQQLFLALLADFKFQQSNKKFMIDEVHNLLNRKSKNFSKAIELSNELNLIEWHLERYFLLNNFHGEDTTIQHFFSYLNRRKHKIFMGQRKPMYVKSCMKMLQKAIKSFPFLNMKPKAIDFSNNMWFVEEGFNEKKSFSSLVYSDSQQIYQMYLRKNYRIPGMEYESFMILQDIAGVRWMNTYLKFSSRLIFRQDVLQELSRRKRDFMKNFQYNISSENCSFQAKGKYGYYFYFVVQGGCGLIASCKVSKQLSTSASINQLKEQLSLELIKTFEANLLQSGLPNLSQPFTAQFSHYFYLKDQSLSRDRIIKLKNWEKMYLSIGFSWALSCNKLTSHLDVCNQILALISNPYYHLYKFDQKSKENFSKQLLNRKKQLLKKESQGLLDESQMLQSSQKSIKQENTQQKSNSIKIIFQNKKDNQVLVKDKNITKPSIQIQEKKPYEVVLQQQFKIPICPSIQIKFNCKLNPFISQLFTKLPKKVQTQKHRTSNDLFGFNHPLIKSHFQYLESQVNSFNSQMQLILKANDLASKSNENSSSIVFVEHKVRKLIQEFLAVFQFQEPFMLQKNTYLHQIGRISIKTPEFKNIMTQTRQIQHKLDISEQSKPTFQESYVNFQIKLNLFDGYIVKREWYSLDNPFRTTVYVNCVLYISREKNQPTKPFYVIFQQSNLAIVYYHLSLQCLIQTFDNHIKKKKLEMKSSIPFRRTLDQQSVKVNSKKTLLMLEQIKAKIQEEIKFIDKEEYISEEQHYNNFLIKKLKSFVNQQNQQQLGENNLFVKIAYPETNEDKTQLVLGALQKLTSFQLQAHGIKSDITALDIFFGYLSKKYFVYEMLFSKFQQNIGKKSAFKTKDPFNEILEQIKLKDNNLYKQMDQIISESLKYADYAFSLEYDQQSLIIQRKFLSGKNDDLQIKIEKNQDQIELQMSSVTDNSKKKLKSESQSGQQYFIEKQQILKTYTFIKQFHFGKQNDRKSQKFRCYLITNENDEDSKIDLDPKQNPLELIISNLVETWDEGEIYQHFKKLIQRQIWQCEYCLSDRMKLYYQSTRKIQTLFKVQEINKFRKILSFRKKDVPKSKAPAQGYPTEYCTNSDQKQTICERIEDGSMVFSDNQIIVCRY